MIQTIDGIPVYNALLSDEGCGIVRISLVDAPAVESNWQAFASVERKQLYKVADEDKHIIRGVVMRADFPIYRVSEIGQEYYIVYTADVIREMAEKYLKENRTNFVNIMHLDNSEVAGVQMVQWFLKDSAKGISPEGFEEIADGSLFAEFHVVNEAVWKAIKQGEFKGFSLEGIFDAKPKEVDNFSKKKKNMGKFSRIREMLAKLFAEFASITTDKGILVWDSEDDLKAGDKVYIEDAEGNRTPAEDGDYTTEDGKVIKVAGGEVAEIVDPEAEVADEFSKVATDKGELEIDEDEVREGVAVFVVNESGERVPAEDGDYVLEDGRAATVAGGIVVKIVDKVAEAVEENAKLRKQIADLKAEVAKLKKQPKAKPAHEVTREGVKLSKTGVAGLDRLSQILSAK